MREIRTCGSEGGAAQANAPFLPLSTPASPRQPTFSDNLLLEEQHSHAGDDGERVEKDLEHGLRDFCDQAAADENPAEDSRKHHQVDFQ